MYIEGRYWNNFIGDTDDSLTLVDYLADKRKEEIPLSEIFSDTGLDRQGWQFRESSVLEYQDREGCVPEFHYAIDLVTDLAALLLECRVSGSVSLEELQGGDGGPVSRVRITATEDEMTRMNQALSDFVFAPLDYDLSEMCSEEEMQKLAEVCKSLMKELFR